MKAKKTKSGPCLEISCATLFSAKDPPTFDFMHFALHAPHFREQTLNATPTPDLRKLTICSGHIGGFLFRTSEVRWPSGLET
jgi:hypothetical protein